MIDRIRFDSRVADVRRGWELDGERFDGVVLASGRFRKPYLPAALSQFAGELIHAFDYPGASELSDRTLVYGNGISGLEIASDVATAAPVVSAFREPRYVIQRWSMASPQIGSGTRCFGTLERRHLSPEQWSHRQRERIIRLAGNPAEFGVPEPDPDLRVAGVSLCQDYLAKARDKCITCRPAITGIAGNSVTFADGTTDRFGAIICATGYELHMPYLDPELRSALGIAPALYQRTFHPDLPGLGVIGQFLAQGPYFPLLELQARWIIAVWTGEVKLPDERAMCSTIAEGQPSLDAHNALAGIASRARGSSRSRSSRRLRTPARPICHIGRSRLVIGAVTMTNGGTAMLEKIFYTSVLVSDQDKALDFYTNVLGLEKRVENPTPDGPRFITVGVTGDDFQLVLWPGTPGQAQPAMGRPPASITIETDDCRKSVDELKSRGVEFVSDVLEFPWGYVAQFQDPDGNRLQLREGR